MIHAIGSGVDSEEILGTRGAGLARAHELGLCTPAGFTLAKGSHVEVDEPGSFSPNLQSQLAEGLSRLESELEERLDSSSNPLFLTVTDDRPSLDRGRLTVGLTEHTLPALEARVGTETAAEIWTTTLRRFAEEVRGIDAAQIAPAAAGDSAAGLLALIEEASGSPFPRAGADQLRETILARWRSSPRKTAITVHRSVLPIEAGDPVDVGVAFTRNPSTGETGMFGGFPIDSGFECAGDSPVERMLSRSAPRVLGELAAALPLVELAYKQICTISFSVEAGRMTVVDVRPSRGSAMATNKMLVDMVEDQVLSVEEAIELAPLSAPAGRRRTALAAERDQVLGIGSGLTGGAAVAPIAIGESGVGRLRSDTSPILVLGEGDEASPALLSSCAGLLIACATAADHPLVAAARAQGIPIVAGVRRLGVNEMLGLAAFPDIALREGETLALDGGSGVVAVAEARKIVVSSSFSATEILSWCRNREGVPVVAEVPADWSVVTDPEALADADLKRPLLIDLAAAGYEERMRLLRLVATIPEGQPLGLRPPPVLSDTLQPPSARWELIVAEKTPVMELLAAKLALLATARGPWINGDRPSAFF